MNSKLIRLRLYRVYIKCSYKDWEDRVYNIRNYQKKSKRLILGKFMKIDSGQRKYIDVVGENPKDIVNQLVEIKNAIQDIVEVNDNICKIQNEIII